MASRLYFCLRRNRIIIYILYLSTNSSYSNSKCTNIFYPEFQSMNGINLVNSVVHILYTKSHLETKFDLSLSKKFYEISPNEREQWREIRNKTAIKILSLIINETINLKKTELFHK